MDDVTTDDAVADLDAVYADLDREIAAAGPVCRASGRCCRFREYGHTLFLSRLEAARLLAPGLPAGADVGRDGCPYQAQGLCTARDRRPLGCRIYYCDPSFSDRMAELSERYIARLKSLHELYGMVWEYRPLHAFLEEASGVEGGGERGAGEGAAAGIGLTLGLAASSFESNSGSDLRGAIRGPSA